MSLSSIYDGAILIDVNTTKHDDIIVYHSWYCKRELLTYYKLPL